MQKKAFDVAVIGAGCFGAWCAHELQRAGHTVALLDAFGPAHSRASSGGESRIIRMGYGADELYTCWSQRSLEAWRALSERLGRPLFQATGMLWLSATSEGYVRQTQSVLARLGVVHEELSAAQLAQRFPQIALDDVAWGLLEPGSGVLMARQAVQALVQDGRTGGLDYRLAKVVPPALRQRLDRIMTTTGDTLTAGAFVFACGPWLPQVFPELLAPRIFPTRQEVYFFAPPAGSAAFAAPAMPAWLHHPDLVYGLPDLESRGFKLSIDRHGPAFDPDAGSRLPSSEGLAEARAYLARRFPALAHATLNESRVCQYENTANGDFIIDRHPQCDNVYIVGGGSGHGFKHGPAVGAYVRGLIEGSDATQARFALAGKGMRQARSVY